ncbi:DUF4215 domain-containing protein [bacterium]|jgi:cysteine-rich repeat protein|nr:DUF4215 domain-containing protein [bacterium]
MKRMIKLDWKNLLLWGTATIFIAAALTSILLTKAAQVPLTFFIDQQLTENCLNDNYLPTTHSCSTNIKTGYSAWSTASQALQEIKHLQDIGTIATGGHMIYIRAGMYREYIYDLHWPSGIENRRNTISGYNDERVIFSGASAKDAWVLASDDIYKTSLTSEEANRPGAWEDDQPLHIARFPEDVDDTLIAQELTRYHLIDPALNQLLDEQIIDSWMEIMTELDWHVKAKIESYDRDTHVAIFYADSEYNQLLLPGDNDGFQYRQPLVNSPYHLINNIKLLDHPGEYYYDVDDETKELYMMTLGGGHPDGYLIEVGARSYIFRLEEEAHYLDFKDLEMRHGYYGVYLHGDYEGGNDYLDRGPTDISFDNFYVHHNRNKGVYLSDYVYNIDILNSRVEYNIASGIYARGYDTGDSDYLSAKIRISNNRLIYNGGVGAGVTYLKNAEIDNNYLDYNGLHKLSSTISIHTASYTDVHDNTILHAGGNSILLEGRLTHRNHHVNVYDNYIEDSSWLNNPTTLSFVCGIWISDTDDSNTYNNYISSANSRAFHIDAGDRNKAWNNTFVNIHDDFGDYNSTALLLENFDGPAWATLGYARDNIIANNIFIGDFARGYSVFAAYPNEDLSNVTGNIIANNIFYSTKAGQDIEMENLQSSVDHSLNTYSNNLFYAPNADGITFKYLNVVYDDLIEFKQASEQEIGSLIDDPEFVNFGTEDFNLQSNSPAIDAGLVISGLNENYQGYAPDIGRFEFASAPICGNGVAESGEECDDGNNDNGDGCSSICQDEVDEPVCGNSIIEDGEQCDDGNDDGGDGCSSTCQDEDIGGDEPITTLVDIINLQGSLIKSDNDPRIYYITEQDKRYYIPNVQTYLSWFADFTNIEIVDQVTLNNDYPYQGRLTVKPGNLVKFQDDQKVYVIKPTKVLRWIDSAVVFKEFGYNFNKIIHLPAIDFDYYLLGEPISSSDVHSSGQVLKHGHYPEIFYIEDNIEYWIKDSNTFLSLGFKWRDVITIPVRYWYTRVLDDLTFRLKDW